MDDDKPAFRVITRDGHEYAIWSTGKVSGFPPGPVIMNGIPALLWRERMAAQATDKSDNRFGLRALFLCVAAMGVIEIICAWMMHQ